jgi:tetratricopeptide (TPR) repeat protein
LGAGGFGVVFRAFDPDLNREVALKTPRPDVATSPALHARFIAEAQAAAALDNPGIVPVFETGRIGPIWYISTAMCTGPTLAAWLGTDYGPVPTNRAVELVRQLAEAIQHAHDRGVLHRDLKPSNVLLEPRVPNPLNLQDYQPRITDFGLAKRLDTNSQNTKAGAVLGTPRYMAPEQVAARNEAISVQTDVYALGVILYELLTGAPPLVGESDVQTMSMILENEPRPPQRRGAKIDRDLTSICLTCLRKTPAERYPSARELADDLGRYLRGEPVKARPLRRLTQTVRWCRRRPLVASLAGLLCAVSVSGLAGIAWQWARANANLATARSQEHIAKQQLSETELLLVNMAWLLDDLARYRQPSDDSISLTLHAELGRDFYEVLNRHHKTSLSPVLRAVAELQQGRLASAAKDDVSARRHMQASLALWQKVLAEPSADILSVRAAAMTLFHYGNHLARGENRVAVLGQVLNGSLLGQIPVTDRTGKMVAREYVRFLNAEAELSFLFQRYDLARQSFEAAAAVAEKLSTFEPADTTARLLLSSSQLGVATVRRRIADRPEALAACEKALAVVQALPVESGVISDDALDQIAKATRLRASLLRDMRLHDETLPAYREALAFSDLILARRPNDVNARVTVAKLAVDLARILGRQGRYDEAVTVMERSLQIWEDIGNQRQLTIDEQLDVGVFHYELGNILLDAKNADRAKREFDQSLVWMNRATKQEPETRGRRVVLAECHSSLARIAATEGNLPEAIQHLETALTIFEPIAIHRPVGSAYQRRLHDYRDRLNDYLARQQQQHTKPVE